MALILAGAAAARLGPLIPRRASNRARRGRDRPEAPWLKFRAKKTACESCRSFGHRWKVSSSEVSLPVSLAGSGQTQLLLAAWLPQAGQSQVPALKLSISGVKSTN